MARSGRDGTGTNEIRMGEVMMDTPLNLVLRFRLL